MSTEDDQALAARVSELERSVKALAAELAEVRAGAASAMSGQQPYPADAAYPTQTPGVAPYPAPAPGWQPPQPGQAPPGWQPPQPGQTPPGWAPQPQPDAALGAQKRSMSTEALVSRLGIGLLIIGLGFLFKYGVDRGMLGPAARVTLGGLLGLALFGGGLALQRTRSALSQVLLGGAFAALFTTAYAAYDLYQLVSATPLVVGLTVLHVAYFALAVRTSRVSLAVLGALGAYATPFMMLSSDGSSAGLLLYVTAVTIGVGAVLAARGWGVLVWFGAVPAYLAVAAGTLGADEPVVVAGVAAIAVAWAAFGLVPGLRPLLVPTERAPALAAAAMVPVAGLLSLALLNAHLELEDAGTALVGGVWCAVSLAFAALLRRKALSDDAPAAHAAAGAQLVAAVIGMGIALHMGLDGDVRTVAQIVVAVAACVVAGRSTWSEAGSIAPLLWAPVGLVVLDHVGRAIDHRDPEPVLTMALDGVATVALVACAALAPGLRPRGALALLGYLGWLAWAFFALPAFDNGAALGSVFWAVAGVGALVAGLRFGVSAARGIGMATLVGLVAKLLLVDLADMAAVWRILLFMGFGVCFLALGYLMPRLARDAASPD